ncbi:MAG: insulinase family protein [Eubacterium sp.]|nr:insulinase family protein [Eubacterium sp.]
MVKNYTLIEEKKLPEIEGTGYLLSHNKTKARVLIVDNNDENKVFCIGFRTPPENSKGVQHIIEHTVLCGSKKYPVKDPFVELCKGSLNTFLNAMTYPDKTLYPVASCNDKDFQNLMDVYLDAVFNPNIYDKEEIFMQEGWHYEMESPDAPLTINGVVYNEMKGVYSSADSVASRAIENSLFPDTVYSLDSGGAPTDIPELSREEYLDCHRRFYHPSNSYIYLYGDMDFNEKLEYIDREYLSKYDYLKVDSEITAQKTFDAPREFEAYYAVSEDEDLKQNTYLSYNTVVGKSTDVTLNTAFDILCYMLLDTPGAPLKKAIVDTGICAEVDSTYEDELMQPEFSIIARNSDEENKDVFINTINETLTEMVEKGLDKKALLAAVNHFEFKHKEANFGRYPKGLMLILDAFGSWLYDEKEALTRFSMNGVYEELKSHIDDGFFEDIIRKYILQNPHKTIGVIKPSYTVGKEAEAALNKKLQNVCDSLTAEEKERIVEETRHLKEYQSEPSPEEDLEKIPMLQISDIKKEARKLVNRECLVDDYKVIAHDIFTNGISYLTVNFSTVDLCEEEIYASALLSEVLKYVDTDKYPVSELSGEIDIKTGGMAFGVGVVTKTDGSPYSYFFGKMKCFDENIKDGVELLSEVMFHSHITDRKKLKEIISETKANIKMDLLESGNVTASLRACSHLNKATLIKEKQEGLDYYRFLDELEKNYDEKYEGAAALLERTLKKMFRKDALTLSYISDKNPEDMLAGLLQPAFSELSEEELGEAAELSVKKENEGFTSASKVQYVVSAGDYSAAGLKYTGALNVLRIIFGYEYLWLNVRVKGGAYGCYANFTRSGLSMMSSYRDPKLKETLDIYKDAYEYVKNFEVSERDMTKYIIGTIGGIDTPFTPQSLGGFSFASYLMGITNEDIQRDRDEVLSTDRDTIRSLAPYVKVVADENSVVCAVGNEDTIKASSELFDKVENIYAGK